MLDMALLAAELAVIVDDAVGRATQPLIVRLTALETRDVAINDDALSAAARSAVADLPRPRDGSSVTIDDVRPMIDIALAAAVAALPPAEPGAPADPEVTRQMVAEAVAAVPRPSDGVSVTADDVRPLIAAEVRAAVAGLPKPKDGKGLAGAMIDRNGSLIMTLSDGTLTDLGRVEGKDGDHGMGPEDVDATLMEDGRTVRFAFTKGDTEYAFQIPFPVVIDRGVFKDGQSYETGDAVTFGGSLWIAQRGTNVKPDGAGTGWRLAVKKGRDGRDLTKD